MFEQGKNIDASQSKLNQFKDQKEVQSLSDFLKTYEGLYENEVNNFEKLHQAVLQESPVLKTQLEPDANAIQNELFRLVAFGAHLIEGKKVKVDQEGKPIASDPKIRLPSLELNPNSVELQEMRQVMRELKTTLDHHRELANKIIAIETALHSVADLEKKQETPEKVLSKWLDFARVLEDAGLPAETKKLYTEKASERISYYSKILEKNGKNPEDLKLEIEVQSCPTQLQSFWRGKLAVNQQDWSSGVESLNQFLNNLGDIQNLSPKWQTKLQEYIKEAKKLLKSAEVELKTDADFYEGSKLLNTHQILAAKLAFKKFVQTHPEKADTQNYQIALTSLKNIAAQQLQNVKLKFAAMEKPAEIKQVKKGMEFVEIENPKFKAYGQYLVALNKIETAIQEGKFLDFNDAYQAFAQEIEAIGNGEEYNFLKDETELEKGKPALLQLARKYRSKNQYALAEQSYMQYFSTRMSTIAKESFSFDQFKEKYRNNKDLQTKLDETKQAYDKEVQAGKAMLPWDETVARTRLLRTIYQETLPDILQNEQQRLFTANPDCFQDEEAKQAWQEFADMKGIKWNGTWKEPFALSDVKVGQVIQGVLVTLPLTFFTLGVGTVAEGGGLALATRLGAAQLLRLGAQESSKRLLLLGVSAILFEQGCLNSSLHEYDPFQNFDILNQPQLKPSERSDFNELPLKSEEALLMAEKELQSLGMDFQLSKLFVLDTTLPGELSPQDKLVYPNFKSDQQLLEFLRKTDPEAKIIEAKKNPDADTTYIIQFNGKQLNISIGKYGIKFNSNNKYIQIGFFNARNGFVDVEESDGPLAYEKDKEKEKTKVFLFRDNQKVEVKQKYSMKGTSTLDLTLYKDTVPTHIDTMPQFTKLLTLNKSLASYKALTWNIPASLKSTIQLDDLREIIRLGPSEPEAYEDFIANIAPYAKNDQDSKDEYRDPITTLRSGWADCDDYTILNAYWSHLNGYKTFIVSLDAIPESEKQEGDPENGHVFTAYQNQKGEMIILDNTDYHKLPAGQTISDYLSSNWPRFPLSSITSLSGIAESRKLSP